MEDTRAPFLRMYTKELKKHFAVITFELLEKLNGVPAVKQKVRQLLLKGWFNLHDKNRSFDYLQQAHKEASSFVRLHTCTHASLFVHALIRKDRVDAQRELWLMLAAGPVTFRNRIIHFSQQNRS